MQGKSSLPVNCSLHSLSAKCTEIPKVMQGNRQSFERASVRAMTVGSLSNMLLPVRHQLVKMMKPKCRSRQSTKTGYAEKIPTKCRCLDPTLWQRCCLPSNMPSCQGDQFIMKSSSECQHRQGPVTDTDDFLKPIVAIKPIPRLLFTAKHSVKQVQQALEDMYRHLLKRHTSVHRWK